MLALRNVPQDGMYLLIRVSDEHYLIGEGDRGIACVTHAEAQLPCRANGLASRVCRIKTIRDASF